MKSNTRSASDLRQGRMSPANACTWGTSQSAITQPFFSFNRYLLCQLL